MHDIWNPWHGCRKCSEGCENCYMYYLDAKRNRDGAQIYRTGSAFRYPLSRDRSGRYKVRSGEMLRVCMTSDFFLEEADPWREEAWSIIAMRPDVRFFLLTGRNAPSHLVPSLYLTWMQFSKYTKPVRFFGRMIVSGICDGSPKAKE